MLLTVSSKASSMCGPLTSGRQSHYYLEEEEEERTPELLYNKSRGISIAKYFIEKLYTTLMFYS